MQKIVPHLWYDTQAMEAAAFYVSLFENSRILDTAIIKDTPSGDAETVRFELAGQLFAAISGGPFFEFNPSVSLMVACDSAEEVNTKWTALAEGGSELMPLGEYPFSKRYGWIIDRFGLSWQLRLTEHMETRQKITPNLLFTSDANGKAEDAIHFYTEVFSASRIGAVNYYSPGEATAAKARVIYAAFELGGCYFSAMDNAYNAPFTFNEAFSLMVLCDGQQEIDYHWEKLSAVPEAEQCGWVKDKYGISWQVVPENMQTLLSEGTEEAKRRAIQAMLKMKKIDIAALEHAKAGTL